MILDLNKLPNSQYNECSCGGRKKVKANLCSICYKRERHISQRTKDQINGENWWTRRIPIAKHARKIYSLSDRPKKCVVCGYNKHYEVCHIKAVAEFDNTVTIEDINNINNLVSLCRNCHWEFDKGLIKL